MNQVEFILDYNKDRGYCEEKFLCLFIGNGNYLEFDISCKFYIDYSVKRYLDDDSDREEGYWVKQIQYFVGCYRGGVICVIEICVGGIKINIVYGK